MSFPTRQILAYSWMLRAWKWNFPLKLECFFWLVVHNHILTWEILCKKGFHGLGRCNHCLSFEEDAFHLFILCPFSCSVWNGVLHMMTCPVSWDGPDIISYLGRWYLDHKSHCILGFFIIWGIWKSRNSFIFDHVLLNIWRTYCRILSYCFEFIVPLSFNDSHPPPPKYLWSSYPMGFFDGASSFNSYGCGMAIHINFELSYRFYWHCD